MKNAIKINQEVSSNNEAVITSGVYQTPGYQRKEYTTKSALVRGLIANGFPDSETYNGQTWNYAGKLFTLRFS